LEKGQKKQGLKPEFDFSLADALAARYDTVTIGYHSSYAVTASYLMTLIKPACLVTANRVGFIFYYCFPPFLPDSIKLERNRKRLPAGRLGNDSSRSLK